MWRKLSLRARLNTLLALVLMLGLAINIARLLAEAGPRVQAALIEGCLAHEAGCRLSSREVNVYVGLFIDRPSKPAVPSSFGQEYATLGIQVR